MHYFLQEGGHFVYGVALGGLAWAGRAHTKNPRKPHPLQGPLFPTF